MIEGNLPGAGKRTTALVSIVETGADATMLPNTFLSTGNPIEGGGLALQDAQGERIATQGNKNT